MINLIQNITEQSSGARADRFYSGGTVVSVDAISGTAQVDVGSPLPDGTPTYRQVAYSPQQPPQLGDSVTIMHTNISPHSGVIVAMQKGNSQVNNPNNAQVVENGGVSTLNGLMNAILLAVVNGSIAVAGQTITITCAGGITSPLTTKGDLWAFGTADTREPIGPDGDVLTADSTQANGMKWTAAPVVSVNGIAGAPDVVAGSGIGVAVVGSNIEVTNTAAVEVVKRNNGSTGTAMPSNLLHVILTGTTTTYVIDPSVAQAWQILNGTAGEVTITCAAGAAFANVGTTVSMPPNEYALFVAIYNGSSYDVYLLNSGLHVVSLSATATLTPQQVYNAAVHVDATAGAVTITLPDAAQVVAAKFPFSVKKIDASGNVVMVQGTGGQTLDGASSKTLGTQYQGITLYSDGFNFYLR